MKRTIIRKINFLILMGLFTSCEPALAVTCSPTPWDEIGPFYRPNAPERTSIGKGYIVSGTFRSAGDCRPLHNVWMGEKNIQNLSDW